MCLLTTPPPLSTPPKTEERKKKEEIFKFGLNLIYFLGMAIYRNVELYDIVQWSIQHFS